MSALKDLTGQRFGRLTVLERAGSDNHERATWRCLCDCGQLHTVAGYALVQGHIKSCGCVRKEYKGRTPTHGKSHTRLYETWNSMKRRCYMPRDKSYPRYGGRGITICDEWHYDFQAFYDWAMANGYDENAPYGQCTIDRIDNDKGYSPDNCRWVNMVTQRNNRMDSRKDNKQ